MRHNRVLWLCVAALVIGTLWLLAGAVITIVANRDALEDRVTELERVDIEQTAAMLSLTESVERAHDLCISNGVCVAP